jgi:hypothetical protein
VIKLDGQTIFNKKEGDGSFNAKRGTEFCKKLNTLAK